MGTKTLTIMTLAIGLLAAAWGGGPASGSGASVVDDEPEVEATGTADDEVIDGAETDEAAEDTEDATTDDEAADEESA